MPADLGPEGSRISALACLPVSGFGRAVSSSLEEGLQSRCYWSITFSPLHYRHIAAEFQSSVQLNGLEGYQKEEHSSNKWSLSTLEQGVDQYSKRCKFLLNLSPPEGRRDACDIVYIWTLPWFTWIYRRPSSLQFAALSLDFCVFSRPKASWIRDEAEI